MTTESRMRRNLTRILFNARKNVNATQCHNHVALQRQTAPRTGVGVMLPSSEYNLSKYSLGRIGRHDANISSISPLSTLDKCLQLV